MPANTGSFGYVIRDRCVTRPVEFRRMGLYAKLILPRLLDLTMRNHRLVLYRQQADPLVIADRLDVTAGPARKLAYSDVDVRHDNPSCIRSGYGR